MWTLNRWPVTWAVGPSPRPITRGGSEIGPACLSGLGANGAERCRSDIPARRLCLEKRNSPIHLIGQQGPFFQPSVPPGFCLQPMHPVDCHNTSIIHEEGWNQKLTFRHPVGLLNVILHIDSPKPCQRRIPLPPHGRVDAGGGHG